MGLALAGCSGAPGARTSSGSAPASSVAASTATAAPKPASGTTITGTGYRYTVPKGWGEPKADVGQSSTDSFAADLDDKDGFADNVNVLVVTTGDVPADEIEKQAPAQLKSIGGSEIAVRDRVRIAGSESAHLSALRSASGAEYRIEQYYLLRSGKGYIITFSFSPDVSRSDREGLAGSVLSSWTFD